MSEPSNIHTSKHCNKDNKLYYLINHLVKAISLPDFVEMEADRQLRWTRNQMTARCHCPMPNHNDRNASFTINRMNDDNWIFHCLAGDTNVITWNGVYPIKELAGTKQIVLTEHGRWIEAPFNSYGYQKVSKITLSRNGQKKIIKATPEHRWFIKSRQHKVERKTKELKIGNRLAWAFPQNKVKQIGALSPQGIAHGIVFGDGTAAKTMSLVNLWGNKDGELLKWFPLNRNAPISRDNGLKGISALDLPFYYKNMPPLDESPSYLAGFLAGWIAADGHVAKDGTTLLNSSTKDNLEYARLIAMRLGIGTYGITCQNRMGINNKMSAIYRIHFITEDLDERFFLVEDHRYRFVNSNKKWIRRCWVVTEIEEDAGTEEVFCANVDETHSFALEDNILTGNCFGCGTKGNIVHFCMDYYGLRNKLEAILFLCKKFDIKDKEDLILQGIKNVSKKVDVQRKMENANILVSNQCRMLLRSDYEKHNKWVLNTYKLLDSALETENCEMIEKIGYEASNRMTGVI